MKKPLESVLGAYLETYRDLIATDTIDENSIVLSFPFHLAAGHRIEITVTATGEDTYTLSDAGRTIGELQEAGFTLTKATKGKLERIANLSGLRLVHDFLVLQASTANLGISIQRYLEVCKMIGDVYLVHRQRTTREDSITAAIKGILDASHVLYRERAPVHGAIESHPFDFFVPPNGSPGLAAKVISGQNTHQLAAFWYYKCDDIRAQPANWNIKLALVYDVQSAPWSDASRMILERRADVAIPSDSIDRTFSGKLIDQGILKVV